MNTYKLFLLTLVALILVTLALADAARAESAQFYDERGGEAVNRRGKGNRSITATPPPVRSW